LASMVLRLRVMPEPEVLAILAVQGVLKAFVLTPQIARRTGRLDSKMRGDRSHVVLTELMYLCRDGTQCNLRKENCAHADGTLM
jgi:hypothetical protein